VCPRPGDATSWRRLLTANSPSSCDCPIMAAPAPETIGGQSARTNSVVGTVDDALPVEFDRNLGNMDVRAHRGGSPKPIAIAQRSRISRCSWSERSRVRRRLKDRAMYRPIRSVNWPCASMRRPFPERPTSRKWKRWLDSKNATTAFSRAAGSISSRNASSSARSSARRFVTGQTCGERLERLADRSRADAKALGEPRPPTVPLLARDDRRGCLRGARHKRARRGCGSPAARRLGLEVHAIRCGERASASVSTVSGSPRPLAEWLHLLGAPSARASALNHERANCKVSRVRNDTRLFGLRNLRDFSASRRPGIEPALSGVVKPQCLRAFRARAR
jgi:hypothetical protein